MMPSVKYTEPAADDITEIVDYTIEHWGQDQAMAYIDDLEKLAQSLAERPLIRKVCVEIAEGLRAFPFQSHVLYYVTAEHGITVWRVLHKTMNPSLHFEVFKD